MVYDATFLDVPVFTSIKLVEWHEDYGTTGYLMTTGCHNEGISGGFPIYPHNETVVQEMFVDEQQETSIGVEVVQDFRMSNWGSTCNARYSQVYQFFEDGSFRVIGGAFGKGCGTNATYRPVFRVAMSIQGEGNDNFAYWNESEWVSAEIETYRSPYADFDNGPHSANEEGYSWYIYDVTGDGYYIEPNQNLSDSPHLDNPFIYVTLQHPNSEGDVDLEVIGNCCEDDFRQGPETFLNYETLVNQNLVLWYVPQRETVVEDENYQCWTLQAGENPITYPCWSGLKFILSE